MKKILFAVCTIVPVLIFGQIPSSGLIGGWCFSGNANDIVGSNHGTVFNATLTADRFGNPNSAYNFNGSTGYIKMLSAGPTGTVSRSVSFWAKRTSTASQQCSFDYGTPGGIGSFHILFNYTCQGIGFDQGSTYQTRGSTLFTDGNWHHFVVVFNSTISTQMNSMVYYVDGVAMSNTISCGGNSTINTGSMYPITIGRTADAPSRFFNGALDDIYFYGKALTPSEVLALYNDIPCVSASSAPGTISGSTNICMGATVIYSVAPVPGVTSYTWTLPGGWTGTSTTNTIAVTAGSNPGQITVATKNCCGSSQPTTQDITVNPTPSLSVSASQYTICNGNSATLIANGASTYTWNSFLITPSITVSPSVTTTYTLSGTNSFGCNSTTTTNLVVTNNPLPTINVTGPGQSCPGQTINLASNGANTYTWQPGNLNGFFVTVSPTVTTVYTVTGTNSNGCYNSAAYTQTVATCAGINEVGNNGTEISISPNPSNGNFVVNCKNLKTATQLEIYNSIGQSVYVKMLDKDIDNIETKLADGVYYVIIKEGQKSGPVQKIIIEQ